MLESEQLLGSDSLQTFRQSVDMDLSTPQEVEEEEATPAQVLAEMRAAWQNEVSAPVLLPHRFDAVDALVDQLEGMDENLDRCSDKGSLKVAVHRMELMRIKYLVNDYVRIRLGKIEANCRGVLIEHNRRVKLASSPLMDQRELDFVVAYAKAEADVLGKAFLYKLPATFRKIDIRKIEIEHDRVFAHTMARETLQVEVPSPEDATSSDVVEMEPDSVHLIPFKSVQEHIEDGRVRLL